MANAFSIPGSSSLTPASNPSANQIKKSVSLEKTSPIHKSSASSNLLLSQKKLKEIVLFAPITKRSIQERNPQLNYIYRGRNGEPRFRPIGCMLGGSSIGTIY
jgi:hypothetical protein